MGVARSLCRRLLVDSNRKLPIVMALSNTFRQCAPDTTKFGEIMQKRATSPFKVIQGHRYLYQSQAYIRLLIKTIARPVLRIKSWIYQSARNLYRGRRAVSLQTFTTRHSNRKMVHSYGSVNDFYTTLSLKLPNFLRITQNKGHFAVQGHSRSPILVPIESSYTTFY